MAEFVLGRIDSKSVGQPTGFELGFGVCELRAGPQLGNSLPTVYRLGFGSAFRWRHARGNTGYEETQFV